MTGQWKAGARGLALALLVLLMSPGAGWAHAVLLSASPAPDHIALTFNEPVRVLGLRLIDTAGADRSPETTPQSADGKIVWKMPAPLGPGRYLVSWCVESLDGHMANGTFTFAADGAEAALVTPAAPGAGVEVSTPWLYHAFHAAARVLILFAIGMVAFRLLLAPEDPNPWLSSTARGLALVGLVSLSLLVVLEGAMRAGVPIADALTGTSLLAALSASNFIWRGFGLVGLGLIAAGAGRKVQGLGAALAVLSIGDSGHALNLLPYGTGHVLMITHGLAAALWMGAIAPLRRALSHETGEATQVLFRRFQTYGGIAMGLTLASGIALSWAILPHFSDLWRSDYGVRLCAKLAAVGVMVLIAGSNRLFLTRRALAGRHRMSKLLGIVLGFDVAVAAMATVLAVGLSLGPPPSPSLEVRFAGQAYGGALSFAPGKAGDNDLSIIMASSTGLPADFQEVTVRLTAPGLEPVSRKATRTRAGHYSVRNLPLWVAGEWKVEVDVLVDDFTQVEFSTGMALPR